MLSVWDKYGTEVENKNCYKWVFSYKARRKIQLDASWGRILQHTLFIQVPRGINTLMGVLLHQSRGTKRTQGAFSLMNLMLRLQWCERPAACRWALSCFELSGWKIFRPLPPVHWKHNMWVLSWNHNGRPPAWFIRERREGWMAELPNLFEECMDWFPWGPWVFI